MPRESIAAVKRRDPVARVGLAVCAGFLTLFLFFGWLWWRATNEPRVHLTLFFPNTVHGVDVGSPVKILGIPAGQIESLGVRLPTPQDPSHYATVKVVLDGTLLEEKGLPRHLDARKELAEEIARGLRGRLRLISPMQGTLYLELTYDPATPVRFVASPAEGVPEVPTLPDPLSEGLLSATHRFADLQRRDFAAIESEIMERLARIESAVDPEGFRAVNDSLLEKLAEARAAFSNPRLKERLASVNADLVVLRERMAEYDGKSEKGVREIAEAAARLRKDLERTSEETARIARVFDPRSASLLGAYARLAVLRDNVSRVRSLCEEFVFAKGFVPMLTNASAGEPEQPGARAAEAPPSAE